MVDAHRRAAVAERAARAGGAVARESFRGELDISTKRDKADLVTDADVATQRQVLGTLVSEFPDDPIVGEEEDGVPPEGPDTDMEPNLVDAVPETGDAWVVDPIDGTANYVRGVQLWATSIAAVTDGEPVAGATYLPSLGEMYTAGADAATRDGTELTVSDRTDPEAFVVARVGRYFADRSDAAGDGVAAAIERFGELRRYGSLQATLAFVASGGLDAAFVPAQPDPWDTVAGVHLIRAAGGTVTDAAGDRWTLDSDSLVASNGAAHDTVRSVTAEERA